MRLEPFNHSPSATVQDSVIASSLITAPAWSTWLGEINGLLTTLSLVIGVTIGVHRLWRIFRTPPPSPGAPNPPGDML